MKYIKNAKIYMSIAIISLLLFSTLVVAADGSPPSIPPQPTGPSVVEIGTLHSWAVGRSYDPDGDYISYLWNWNDGDTYQTCPTDEDIIVASHIYLIDGTYDIEVKAIDFYGSESNWSDPFTVDVLGIDISTDKDEYEQGETGICTIVNTLSDNVSIMSIDIDEVSEVMKGDEDNPFPIFLEPGESYECMFLTEGMDQAYYLIIVDYRYNGLLCQGSTGFGIAQPNEPPSIPKKPNGETDGVVGEEYCYETSSIDPDGDAISFMFDWDDGTSSDWVTPRDPVFITLCHSWENAGEYNVSVKAKDSHDAESEWSDALTVTISDDGPTPPPPPEEFDIIIGVRGGLAIVASITNNGTDDLTDVDWNVTVKGGRIFRGINKSFNCTFDTLEKNATGTIRIPGRYIKWIGRVAINITISCGTDEVSKTVNGIVLGPFVIIRG